MLADIKPLTQNSTRLHLYTVNILSLYIHSYITKLHVHAFKTYIVHYTYIYLFAHTKFVHEHIFGKAAIVMQRIRFNYGLKRGLVRVRVKYSRNSEGYIIIILMALSAGFISQIKMSIPRNNRREAREDRKLMVMCKQ